MINPASLLREAIKAVPAVRYALGVAGVTSVIAIVKSFNIDLRLTIIGTIAMFLMMTMLVIFAKISSMESSDFRLPAIVFTWFSLCMIIIFSLAMLLSAVIRWPLDMQSLFISEVEAKTSVETPKSRLQQKMNEFNPVSDETQNALGTITSQGITGTDTNVVNSLTLNKNCPEIVMYDYSTYPPDLKKIRRCPPTNGGSK